MKKTLSLPVLGAVLAAAFAGPALAQTYNSTTGAPSGWSQNHNATQQGGWSQRGTVTEGRNAATMYEGGMYEGGMYDSRMRGPNTQGVEPYIANQIEQNARSTD
ncbi:hypothetical protein [Ancylobacter sp.]|uniref:hypothetical protein n=1 Tax=Ancylobacter sp. TaxID=1872567 RepID=UPI003C7BD612